MGSVPVINSRDTTHYASTPRTDPALDPLESTLLPSLSPRGLHFLGPDLVRFWNRIRRVEARRLSEATVVHGAPERAAGLLETEPAFRWSRTPYQGRLPPSLPELAAHVATGAPRRSSYSRDPPRTGVRNAAQTRRESRLICRRRCRTNQLLSFDWYP